MPFPQWPYSRGFDRLAFQGENAENALVNPPERFSLHESFEAFDPQRELPKGQRALTGQLPFAQSLEMLWQGVLRAVDDSQTLAPAALDRRLQQTTRADRDERQRLDDRALAAPLSQCGPPPRCSRLTRGIGQVDDVIRSCHQQTTVRFDKAADRGHVPRVILIRTPSQMHDHLILIGLNGNAADTINEFPCVVVRVYTSRS